MLIGGMRHLASVQLGSFNGNMYCPVQNLGVFLSFFVLASGYTKTCCGPFNQVLEWAMLSDGGERGVVETLLPFADDMVPRQQLYKKVTQPAALQLAEAKQSHGAQLLTKV